MQLDVHSLELPEPLVQVIPNGRWRVEPAHRPGRLRVNLTSGDKQWVAEYPLLQ